MTDHMQAAIEAGAKAMWDLRKRPKDPNWTPELDYGIKQEWRKDSQAALDAIIPHLRAMIAEEIRDANLPNDPVFYSGAEGYHLGIKAAARIAQGAPRD